MEKDCFFYKTNGLNSLTEPSQTIFRERIISINRFNGFYRTEMFCRQN